MPRPKAATHSREGEIRRDPSTQKYQAGGRGGEQAEWGVSVRHCDHRPTSMYICSSILRHLGIFKKSQVESLV